jgi:hypothetical protein
MNSEPATANLVAGGEGGPKQNSRQMDSTLNDILFTQPLIFYLLAQVVEQLETEREKLDKSLVNGGVGLRKSRIQLAIQEIIKLQ